MARPISLFPARICFIIISSAGYALGPNSEATCYALQPHAQIVGFKTEPDAQAVGMAANRRWDYHQTVDAATGYNQTSNTFKANSVEKQFDDVC